MLLRVADPGRPAFQLRKGEEGLSVFDSEVVQPPLPEAEVLAAFRPGSVVISRAVAEVEGKGLTVVAVPGGRRPAGAVTGRPRRNPPRPGHEPGSIQASACGVGINMALQTSAVEIPAGLLEAIRSLPREREVEHCGRKWVVSPFEFYAPCPDCGTRLKVRSFSAVPEVEDVFDAVFEWMNQPGAADLAQQRREAIRADEED